MVALLVAVILALGTVAVLALDYGVPQDSVSVTSRFFLTGPDTPGDNFSMVSEDGGLIIHVTAQTLVYFEDFVPLSDECDGMTQMVREVLFGRTLAEVLEGRNMRVIYVDGDRIEPISIKILFETAVHLPIEVVGEIDVDGYIPIMTLPGELDYEDWGSELLYPIHLNGEVVVNNVILENAPLPFVYESAHGDIVMVPLRAVVVELGYDLTWNAELQSIQLGVGIHIWVGQNEAHRGRMAPIEFSTAPVIVDNITFVPLDFFRNVLAQTAYVFEGQVVIETYSDMM